MNCCNTTMTVLGKKLVTSKIYAINRYIYMRGAATWVARRVQDGTIGFVFLGVFHCGGLVLGRNLWGYILPTPHIHTIGYVP